MIEIEHLSKRYGEHPAVSDLSVTIESGQIYGSLGPNGAGKATTMNIMAGCLSATEGHVRIGGYDIFDEPEKAKRLIGYLPEQPPLYLNETPMEYLRFVGEAKGVRGAELTVQIADAVARTGIEPVRNRRISTLSKGYRQRVGRRCSAGRRSSFWMSRPSALTPFRSSRSEIWSRSLESATLSFSAPISSPRCRPSATRSSSFPKGR